MTIPLKDLEQSFSGKPLKGASLFQLYLVGTAYPVLHHFWKQKPEIVYPQRVPETTEETGGRGFLETDGLVYIQTCRETPPNLYQMKINHFDY